MIGSIFFRHPEILLHSLSQMNDGYDGRVVARSSGFFVFLQKLYVLIFGIPEIGFQVRSMYFQKAIHKIAHVMNPKRVLDVGSGIGSYVFELSRQFPSSKIDGWEIDKKKLSFSRKFAEEQRFRNVSFAFGDITHKPRIRIYYDVVLTVDVLEHISDYKKALSHMHQVLKPGGFLFIHTPQEHQKRFFRLFDTWEHNDHVREGFSPDILKSDLRNIGFTEIEMVHTFGFFGSLTWELNHMLLSKSFVLAGMLYPLLYMVSRLDGLVSNKKGLCLSVVARKKHRV